MTGYRPIRVAELIQAEIADLLLRQLYLNLSIAPEFVASLAVGGIDGTIRSRFRAPDVIGRVRAKTGTLSGVSALSGYVGTRFAFFVLQNGDPVNLVAAHAAQDRFVRALAARAEAVSSSVGGDGLIAAKP